MRLSSTFSVSQTAALGLTLLRVAAAQPFERIIGDGCATETAKISMDIVCGETNAVLDCVQYYGSESASLQQCLEEAGCTAKEARTEAIWVVERCSRPTTDAREGALELRHVVARETTTASTSTETSTSSSTTTSSDSTATSATTSSTSSSASATTTSSSSSTSTTASSTSSSTASSTSSTATSTSTSTATNTKGMTGISYFVAVLMALFAAGCIGGICFSCCSERSARKKAARAVEAKEALMASH
ncbi:hypothetical protein N0V93_004509 [Gnomoniopsis smithogilvyi]|uniref:Extracellular membrane protein CFEM domain-containing protein n=1 Tax=Gnomoniopsis smithogilvyi TaxID=1191159 RepID=A0A9W8YTV4_9PEZI|nr:hypothetical protein N0V93_004509 [Gnomoniopsis smithogilvyi]